MRPDHHDLIGLHNTPPFRLYVDDPLTIDRVWLLPHLVAEGPETVADISGRLLQLREPGHVTFADGAGEGGHVGLKPFGKLCLFPGQWRQFSPVAFPQHLPLHAPPCRKEKTQDDYREQKSPRPTCTRNFHRFSVAMNAAPSNVAGHFSNARSKKALSFAL